MFRSALPSAAHIHIQSEPKPDKTRLVEGAAETEQRQSHGGEHEDGSDIDLHVGEPDAL